MAVFEYTAMGSSGDLLSGSVIADTPRQARDVLRDRGWVVTGVELHPGARRRSLFSGRRYEQETTSFIRELATLLAAGIPLLKSLQTLSKQRRKAMRAVVQHLADRVASGRSLADAMEERGDFFDDTCVSVVRVGENTGSLDISLKRLAMLTERSARLRGRVANALAYPAVVLVIGLAVAVFLMTYVVPNLLNTLSQAGKELPAVTRVVKAASDLLVGWWWAILAAGLGLVAIVRSALASEKGREAADRLVLRLPVLGDLVRKENTSRVAVVLGALLKSGVPFVEAVRITRKTVSNRVFRRALGDYESAVAAGGDISGTLEASGVFSPMVVQMLAVGQESGELEEMLDHLAETNDQDVQATTHRLVTLLEPFLIVLLAVLVGFIVFATILPILEASNVL